MSRMYLWSWKEKSILSYKVSITKASAYHYKMVSWGAADLIILIFVVQCSRTMFKKLIRWSYQPRSYWLALYKYCVQNLHFSFRSFTGEIVIWIWTTLLWVLGNHRWADCQEPQWKIALLIKIRKREWITEGEIKRRTWRSWSLRRFRNWIWPTIENGCGTCGWRLEITNSEWTVKYAAAGITVLVLE